MSQLILNILCEGDTESKFAESVLKKHLSGFSIVVKTRLLCTSKKKGAAGGMLSYEQVKRDLTLWMNENARKSNEIHHYTTMFDLYRLPLEFPGNAPCVGGLDCYVKVKNVEDTFSKDIDRPSFIPYIQLHEYEALVFAKLDELHDDYPGKSKNIKELEAVLQSFGGNPEKVNSSKSPSKRLEEVLENYNKTKSGPMVAKKAGIDHLKQYCPHFKEWVERLEQLKP